MADSAGAFLQALRAVDISAIERAVALLWWHHEQGSQEGFTAAQLCSDIHSAGYPAQNVSRIDAGLKADPRTRRVGVGYGLKVTAVDELDSTYRPYANRPRPIPP